MKEAGNVDGETVNSEDNKQQELEVSIRDYLILNEIRWFHLHLWVSVETEMCTFGGFQGKSAVFIQKNFLKTKFQNAWKLGLLKCTWLI